MQPISILNVVSGNKLGALETSFLKCFFTKIFETIIVFALENSKWPKFWRNGLSYSYYDIELSLTWKSCLFQYPNVIKFMEKLEDKDPSIISYSANFRKSRLTMLIVFAYCNSLIHSVLPKVLNQVVPSINHTHNPEESWKIPLASNMFLFSWS